MFDFQAKRDSQGRPGRVRNLPQNPAFKPLKARSSPPYHSRAGHSRLHQNEDPAMMAGRLFVAQMEDIHAYF